MDTWVDCGVDAEPEQGSHRAYPDARWRQRPDTELQEQRRQAVKADWQKHPEHKTEAQRGARVVWVVLSLLAILAYVLVQTH